MKLAKARVTNYKSIDDSGWVDFNDITCLVGKNESGKTAFLHALRSLSPEEGVSRNFDILDYPRKNYRIYKKVHDESPAIVITATFELSQNEVAAIESAFGKGVLKHPSVTVSKNYKNLRTWTVGANEEAAVAHVLDSSEISDEIKNLVQHAGTITDLVQRLQAIDDKPPSVTKLLAELAQKFNNDLSHRIINEYLVKWVPRFVYFDDYSVMQGRISIENLITKQSSNILEDSDRTFLALLDLVGVELNEIQKERNYEKLKAALEAGSISITDEVFRFWSQNKQLEVEFDISGANPNDPAPLNTGTILHVRIKNNRHRVTVPFDQRSKGFVWFFSFLTYFSQLEGKTNLLLLLDEPGLSLHAKAQGDFLRFIEERLSPKYQVIYSTHSPFMIDASHFERVRMVQDQDEKGTVISADVLRNDRDTVFPLQAALGYDLAQTLFIGPNCLLVEGPSDLIYLKLLSELAASKGKVALDPRWVIVPVGGADKISTFLSLLGANQLNVAVLMDVNSKDKQRIQNLQQNGLLKTGGLVQISEFTGAKEADIEDLFEPAFYLDLVERSNDGGKKLTLKTLGPGNPRIVKRIEEYFSKEGHSGFSHYAPSVYLLTNQAELIPKIGSATLDRVTQMFVRLNALLPPLTT